MVNQHVIELIKALGQYNWNHVSSEMEIDLAYQAFLDISHWHIEHFIPTRTISMPAKTPSYITPLVKSLLRKKNKLMRKHKIAEASTLATKIGKLISEFRSKYLSQVDAKSSKHLWKMVNGVSGKLAKNETLKLGDQPVDIQALNKHFVSTATDENYDHNAVNKLINQLNKTRQSQSQSQHHSPLPDYYKLEEEEVERTLERTKKTSPGTDNLPYWFFKRCSIQLAPIITHLFNLSLTSGKPPAHWKKAIVTPIPKKANPTGFDDLRPISVTPLLSRILERHIVHHVLLPSIPTTDLNDQFGFRPTGSTTAALVTTMHHVTRLLETNSYVRCISIDFTKAFDTINHPILFSKLQKLNLPPNIMAWIINFLSGRTQAVSVNGVTSEFLNITQSIVQGSGVGPILYIIYASDLCTQSKINIIVKYADDTIIIIPQHTDIDGNIEHKNATGWADTNKLLVCQD